MIPTMSILTRFQTTCCHSMATPVSILAPIIRLQVTRTTCSTISSNARATVRQAWASSGTKASSLTTAIPMLDSTGHLLLRIIW
jgi:hypothetical protein